MTETQKRIKAYQSQLPGLKERVAAVALLLVMSMAMMTSATFAWLTISRSPELSGVTTNLAANGNLEIALATGDGTTPPGESKVGDSSAAEGQSVFNANLTWGNLINLSDPSYGLDNLVLRPAQLNTASLLTKPLFGAVYSQDGRIKSLTTSYGYTSWIPAEGNKPAHFGVSDEVGVRAVSSIKREQTGFAGDYLDKYAMAEIANKEASDAYTAITENEAWLTGLADLLGVHMTASVNGEVQYRDAEITDPNTRTALLEMYAAFVEAHRLEAYAIAQQLNLELFAAYGGNTDAYGDFTVDDILSINTTSDSRIKANGDFSYDVVIDKSGNIETKTIKITNLKTFLNDYNMLVADLAKLKEIEKAGDWRWTTSGLAKVVNNLMDVNKCNIRKDNEPFMTVQELLNMMNGGDYMSLAGWLNATVDIQITNGVLYNLEQRVGSTVRIENLKMKAVKELKGTEITANITARSVVTTATKPSLFQQDLDYTNKTLNTGADNSSGDALAEDTYALVVDFWVRTNAEDSYLTLEGNVLLGEAYSVPVLTEDDNGNQVQLYTLARIYEDENGETSVIMMDVYKKELNGTVKWYVAVAHREVTEEELGDAEPVPRMEERRDVVGFEGENRVWDENNSKYITVDSTTQGVGSCYVYYADSPEDQARSLALLEHLTVAFVDGEGALLATASMDTENCYGESGRFVVPLRVNDDGVAIQTTDETGAEVTEYAITALEQDKATRITAIVFLDGRTLHNENVLSAADIQGQLNLQFGNSMLMKPLNNEKLETETRTVSAEIDNTFFNYDTHEGDMVSNVTIRVNGTQPKNVEAFFLRRINATQGSREKRMRFDPDGSGNWVASHTFEAPGDYVLRSVYLDGVEYVLKEAPSVHIEGFTIVSLNCDQITQGRHIDVLTAEKSTSLDLKLRFASSDPDKMPKSVQGRFTRDEDGVAVNINFVLNPTTGVWNGNGTILNSGKYTMQYLTLDGQHTGLDSSLWITADIKLGMKAAVYTTDITSFKFTEDEMVANGTDQLQMQVKIMDNGDKVLSGLQDVKLTYRLKKSASTIDVDLDWNAATRYYEGDMQALDAGPGEWEFYRLTVGTNVITSAVTYPTFRMQAPEPPSFAGIGPTAMQYRPNGDATMEARIKYSATATVAAVIRDSAGRRYPVMGTAGTTADNVTTWSFAVPNNANGKQDGFWTIETIYLWNYYKADGTYVEWEKEMKDGQEVLKGNLALNADGSLAPNEFRNDDAAMVINVKSSNNGNDFTVKVVQTITVSIAQNNSQDFGKDANGDITGTFMQAHTISGFTATVRDFAGAVDGIGTITLTYTYGRDSLAKGGYTGGDDTYSGFTITLKQDAADKTKFVQDGTVTVRAAGTYTLTGFSFSMTGGSYSTLPVNAPVYTVWSKAPTVTITSAYYKNGNLQDASASTITNGVSTTVYHHYSSQTEICGIGWTQNYTSAKVTIALDGYGSAASAKLVFTTDKADGVVHLYAEGQQNMGTSGTRTDAYEWTGDGTCLRYVGYVEQKENATDEKAPAGTLTATKLIFTYGNATYEFDITDITISNPD